MKLGPVEAGPLLFRTRKRVGLARAIANDPGVILWGELARHVGVRLRQLTPACRRIARLLEPEGP